VFDPAAGFAFRDLAGLYVGPREALLAICIDPTPTPTGRRRTPAPGADRTAPRTPARAKGRDERGERGERGERRPGDRRLALLLEAIDLVVDTDGDRELAPLPELDPRLSASHEAQALIDFLERIDRSVAEHLEIHLVIDRRASCRLPELREWFRRRPRVHVHFTVDHRRWQERALAWLRYAAQLQEQWCAPRSALALEAALHRFVLRPPPGPRAFGWSRSADETLTSLARYLLHRDRR